MPMPHAIAKQKIEIGICRDQSQDEKSIGFCHKLGLDFISCYPKQIPFVKLLATQAEINNKKNRKRVERGV